MKNYIGISLDTSASMQDIALAAGRDYNSTVAAIQEGSTEHNIDTIVSVVKCGVGARATVEREVVNSNVMMLQPIKDGKYVANGHGTPLFDSIDELITIMESVPDANDPQVSFVVQVITDGGENASKKGAVQKVVKKMKELKMTDRWTFSFRVPRGYSNHLTSLGVPAGNILEWDQTDRGVATATAATKTAFKGFYAARSMGATSTDKFYADLSEVTLKEVKTAAVDISKEVIVYEIDAANDGAQIRDFVNDQGVTFVKGCAFYELKKTETVQGYKQIAIREKSTGKVYSGYGARDLLGLPHSSDVKLAPGSHGNYEIYVQSTSVNRKLTKGMGLMIWIGAPLV